MIIKSIHYILLGAILAGWQGPVRAEDGAGERLPIPSWTSAIRACGPWFTYDDPAGAAEPAECLDAGGRAARLSNGFSVDLSTCAEDRAALDRTILLSRAIFDVLACVRGHNPAMASQARDFVSGRHPRIRCLGHLPAALIPRACAEDAYPEGCELRVSQQVGGYAMNDSSDLVMIARDPTIPAITTAAGAADITHELMHAAGIPDHAAFHGIENRERYLRSLPEALRTEETRRRLFNWKAADPVYGVNLLCGGPVAGTPVADAAVVARLRGERGPIPVPEGGTYAPPGNVIEMSCSALKGYRAGNTCFGFLPGRNACPSSGDRARDARENLVVRAIAPGCSSVGLPK